MSISKLEQKLSIYSQYQTKFKKKKKKLKLAKLNNLEK